MTATLAQARDQMLARFKAVVDASSFANTLTPVYDDAERPVPRSDPAKPWCRVVVRHTTSRQSSVSGADGRKRWTRGGFLIFQLFTPKADGQRDADSLVELIRGAYEDFSTPGGVWFRNARHTEVGGDGPWFQTNIFVDFEYDEVK